RTPTESSYVANSTVTHTKKSDHMPSATRSGKLIIIGMIIVLIIYHSMQSSSDSGSGRHIAAEQSIPHARHDAIVALAAQVVQVVIAVLQHDRLQHGQTDQGL